MQLDIYGGYKLIAILIWSGQAYAGIPQMQTKNKSPTSLQQVKELF